MTNFITMTNRITSELSRPSLTAQAKNAINDAIKEASKTRFYFNEVKALSFDTVPGQEYYSDLGLTEIDNYYVMSGASRLNVAQQNNIAADLLAAGNATSGQLNEISRYGEQFRLYPIPNAVYTVYLSGFGRLTPYPLVADADTNAWMTSGEQFIRALAKSYLLKDVVRDYGEATVYEALAEDRKTDLLEMTTLRTGTGSIIGTDF